MIENDGWYGEIYKFEVIEEMDKQDLLIDMYNTIMELRNEIYDLKEKAKCIEDRVDSMGNHFS